MKSALKNMCVIGVVFLLSGCQEGGSLSETLFSSESLYSTSVYNEDEYILLGYSGGEVAPVNVELGIKIKKEQKVENSTFNVALGCSSSFADAFSSFKETSSLDGYFVSRVSILKDDEEALFKNDRIENDFPDANKYAFSCTTVEGAYDLCTMGYRYSYDFNLDFNEINIISGKILFEFGYYDAVNDEFIKDKLDEERIGMYAYNKATAYFSVSGKDISFRYRK